MKRIHEYKRQLLNVLGIIWRYDQIKKMTPDQRAQVLTLILLIPAHQRDTEWHANSVRQARTGHAFASFSANVRGTSAPQSC